MNNVDPSGKTCTENNGIYDCHIDSITYKGNKTVKRSNFSNRELRLVKKFDKSYTKAVNDLAKNPDKSVSINVKGGGPNQTVTAGFIAKTLASRTMIFEDFSGNGHAAQTALLDAQETYVYREGLYGRKIPGYNSLNTDETIRIMLTHEGMHGTFVDKTRGTMSAQDFDKAHQKPYNDAAQQLLDIY